MKPFENNKTFGGNKRLWIVQKSWLVLPETALQNVYKGFHFSHILFLFCKRSAREISRRPFYSTQRCASVDSRLVPMPIESFYPSVSRFQMCNQLHVLIFQSISVLVLHMLRLTSRALELLLSQRRMEISSRWHRHERIHTERYFRSFSDLKWFIHDINICDAHI